MSKQIVIVIKGDTNDADYVYSITNLSPEVYANIQERFERIVDIVECNNGIWPTSEYADTTLEDEYGKLLSAEDIEWFDQYVPHGEHGIHTIDSVNILFVEYEEKLL